tara:strand:- start:38608 stop:38766 length:159 start_codon:yes stop_codon:yes gene_type:complete
MPIARVKPIYPLTSIFTYAQLQIKLGINPYNEFIQSGNVRAVISFANKVKDG